MSSVDVGRDVLVVLREQTPQMVDALEALVRSESPSADVTATATCAAAVAGLVADRLGTDPEHCLVEGRTHLRWGRGSPRVVVLGHFDTVWPLGTTARWPFECSDGVATGPGAFDMKAGIVQGLFALGLLENLEGVTVLLTSDEEIGSPTSRQLIEDTVRGAAGVLVLEPSADGALKTGRKGISTYRVAVEGRASHAGLDPQDGVNAIGELAAQIPILETMGRPALGTTVAPTVVAGGSAVNVVPAHAWCDVDVRTATIAEQHRVHDAIHALSPFRPGTALTVRGGPNRPPLETSAAAALFERARTLAADLHLPPLSAATVGGASDGNFTAALGVPTLDGLGAVGGGAHAEGEHVLVTRMAERAALVAGLVHHIVRGAA